MYLVQFIEYQLLDLMYITNILHCLDDSGNIAKEMPAAARKLFSFMALIIDETTKKGRNEDCSVDIRCFKKGCHGTIKGHISKEGSIDWKCSACDNGGEISDWQGTKWDNRLK